MASFRCFRGIEFPQWLVDFGFDDESHGGDTAALALLRLPYGEIHVDPDLSVRLEPECLVMWVDYDDRDGREFSSGFRYNLYFTPHCDALLRGQMKMLIETDSFFEAREAVFASLWIFNEMRERRPWIKYARHLALAEVQLHFWRRFDKLVRAHTFKIKHNEV